MGSTFEDALARVHSLATEGLTGPPKLKGIQRRVPWFFIEGVTEDYRKRWDEIAISDFLLKWVAAACDFAICVSAGVYGLVWGLSELHWSVFPFPSELFPVAAVAAAMSCAIKVFRWPTKIWVSSNPFGGNNWIWRSTEKALQDLHAFAWVSRTRWELDQACDHLVGAFQNSPGNNLQEIEANRHRALEAIELASTVARRLSILSEDVLGRGA